MGKAMDDVDVLLTCRVPLGLMTGCLERTLNDPAVTETNPAFIIFEPPDQQSGMPAFHRYRLATVGAHALENENQDDGRREEDGEADDRVVFVQYCITPADILLDLASSSLDMHEGERLMRERREYRIDRSMVPSAAGGCIFNESVQRLFLRSRHGGARQMASAAALEGCWILYGLWVLDIGSAIQVSAFTRNGSGLVHRESGPLYSRCIPGEPHP